MWSASPEHRHVELSGEEEARLRHRRARRQPRGGVLVGVEVAVIIHAPAEAAPPELGDIVRELLLGAPCREAARERQATQPAARRPPLVADGGLGPRRERLPVEEDA